MWRYMCMLHADDNTMRACISLWRLRTWVRALVPFVDMMSIFLMRTCVRVHASCSSVFVLFSLFPFCLFMFLRVFCIHGRHFFVQLSNTERMCVTPMLCVRKVRPLSAWRRTPLAVTASRKCDFVANLSAADNKLCDKHEKKIDLFACVREGACLCDMNTWREIREMRGR